MTNLTPEIIETATLNTPYYIDKSFTTDDGVSVAAICDVNGSHVFDCFESDAEEIIKRINCYEQQAETIERLKTDKDELYLAIKAVETQTQITLDEVKEFPIPGSRTEERLENTLRRIQLSLNKLEAGEL